MEKFEPEVFKLFKQIKDGERVETAEYSYRLRDSGRFGFSVTRFAKDHVAVITQQSQQPAQQPIDSGAEVRKELIKATEVGDEARARLLASVIEMKKLAATLVAGLELLQSRIERQ